MKGSVIGQYRVTGILGQGGMGVVYAAEHTLLDRAAAVKVLLPKLSSDQEIVTRFFNEARAATAIRHPGIVEVYDFGRTDDGAAFIVMEYLEGETLRARRKRGRLRWSTALALVRQIAGALGAAHAKGIVHRDLKPANIFLVPDPEVPGGERIKLLDFGIAKLARSPAGQHRTRTGMVIGTPAYMAPEQCRGVAVDARADLYSLGCILFELCTGRPPFVCEAEGDMLVAHIHEPPPTIASLVSGVPQEIEPLVQRMLAKSPAHRVQTADEVIRLIDAARTSISQVSRSGSSPVLAPGTPVPDDAPRSDDPHEPEEKSTRPRPGRSSSRDPQVDATGPTLATDEDRKAVEPATPITVRRDTTLSSAAGTRRRTTRPPARWWAVVGVIGGVLAIAGAVALTFVHFKESGDDDAPIQAAEPPPVVGALPQPSVAPTPASPAKPASPTPPVSERAPVTPPKPPQPPDAGASPAPEESRPSPILPNSRAPERRGDAKPHRPKPATVRITIDSTPRGASVMFAGDVLGKTPYVASVPRGDSWVIFVLRRSGYEARFLQILPNKDNAVSASLEPTLPKPSLAPAVPAAPAPPPPRTPPQPQIPSPPQQQTPSQRQTPPQPAPAQPQLGEDNPY